MSDVAISISATTQAARREMAKLGKSFAGIDRAATRTAKASTAAFDTLRVGLGTALGLSIDAVRSKVMELGRAYGQWFAETQAGKQATEQFTAVLVEQRNTAFAPLNASIIGAMEATKEWLSSLDEQEVRAFGESLADAFQSGAETAFLAGQELRKMASGLRVTAAAVTVLSEQWRLAKESYEDYFGVGGSEARSKERGAAHEARRAVKALTAELDTLKAKQAEVDKARADGAVVIIDYTEQIAALERKRSGFGEIVQEYNAQGSAADRVSTALTELDRATADYIQTGEDGADAFKRFRETLTAARESANGLGSALTDKAAEGTDALTSKAAKGTDALAGLRRELETLGLTSEQLLTKRVTESLETLREGLDKTDMGAADYNARVSEILRQAREQRREDHAETIEQIHEETAARDDAAAQRMSTAENVANAVMSLGSLVTAFQAREGDARTAEQKKAAKAGFAAQQAFAIGSALVNTALAITNALATVQPYPAAIAASIAAGVQGFAQVAAITATSIQGVADAGLMPGALKAAGLNQHSVLAVRNDEAVVDPRGTAALSDMLELSRDRMARDMVGRSGGSQSITLELDGQVLGSITRGYRIADAERGLGYEREVR